LENISIKEANICPKSGYISSNVYCNVHYHSTKVLNIVHPTWVQSQNHIRREVEVQIIIIEWRHVKSKFKIYKYVKLKNSIYHIIEKTI